MATTFLPLNVIDIDNQSVGAVINLNAEKIIEVWPEGEGSTFNYSIDGNRIKQYTVSESVEDIASLAGKHLLSLNAYSINGRQFDGETTVLLQASRVVQTQDADNKITGDKDWSRIDYIAPGNQRRAITAKVSNSSVSAQVSSRMSGNRLDVLYLGKYTISHTNGVVTNFQGTTTGPLANGNAFFVARPFNITHVTFKTNVVDADLSSTPSGAPYIGTLSVQNGIQVSQNVEPGNFRTWHATFTPYIIKSSALLPLFGGEHYYDAAQNHFLPGFSYYYAGFTIPASAATKTYTFEVYMEVEYI